MEGRGENARLADAPGARDLDRLEVGALEVQTVGDHQLDPRCAPAAAMRLRIGELHRHRLLDQHVQAGLRRADRVLGVQVVRSGDVDRVDVAALQHLVVALVGVALVDVVLGAELLQLDRVAGHQRGEPRIAPRVAEGGQHRDLGDVPKSDDGVAHLLSRHGRSRS
jgi:hypothetical protein